MVTHLLASAKSAPGLALTTSMRAVGVPDPLDLSHSVVDEPYALSGFGSSKRPCDRALRNGKIAGRSNGMGGVAVTTQLWVPTPCFTRGISTIALVQMNVTIRLI